jgi:hypothetical protein
MTSGVGANVTGAGEPGPPLCRYGLLVARARAMATQPQDIAKANAVQYQCATNIDPSTARSNTMLPTGEIGIGANSRNAEFSDIVQTVMASVDQTNAVTTNWSQSTCTTAAKYSTTANAPLRAIQSSRRSIGDSSSKRAVKQCFNPTESTLVARRCGIFYGHGSVTDGNEGLASVPGTAGRIARPDDPVGKGASLRLTADVGASVQLRRGTRARLWLRANRARRAFASARAPD